MSVSKEFYKSLSGINEQLDNLEKLSERAANSQVAKTRKKGFFGFLGIKETQMKISSTETIRIRKIADILKKDLQEVEKLGDTPEAAEKFQKLGKIAENFKNREFPSHPSKNTQRLELYNKLIGLGNKFTPHPVEINQPSPISPKDKKDLGLKVQAEEIVQIFKELEDLMIPSGLDFEKIEIFRDAKKRANVIKSTPSCPPEVIQSMEKIITQYRQMVESVEVLSLLKTMSKEIRKPDNLVEPNRPVTERFLDLIAEFEPYDPLNVTPNARKWPFINDLAGVYGVNKVEWQVKWNGIRKKMWDASVEAKPFLEQNKTITLITGSKSSSLPIINRVSQLAPALSHKPALIPTGDLLKHNIVPLAGELGMGLVGVNKANLSGMKFAGLEVCINYASAKGFQHNPEKEIEEILSLKAKYLEYLFMVPRLKALVLRLLLTGSPPKELEKVKKYLMDLRNEMPTPPPVNPNWKSQASLIGKPCVGKGQVPQSMNELITGQIIGVPRSGSDTPKYGIIISKYDDNSCNVLVEFNGVTKSVDLNKITVYSDTALAKSVKNTGAIPLKTEQIEELEEEIKTTRDELEDIISLFDKIKPLELSDDDKKLIKDPFPIVWGSVSLTSEPLRRTDVKGEQMVKGKASFGEDIQIAFTSQENVKTLQTIVQKQGIQVLSFEAAKFILGKDRQTKYSSLYS